MPSSLRSKTNSEIQQRSSNDWRACHPKFTTMHFDNRVRITCSARVWKLMKSRIAMSQSLRAGAPANVGKGAHRSRWASGTGGRAGRAPEKSRNPDEGPQRLAGGHRPRMRIDMEQRQFVAWLWLCHSPRVAASRGRTPSHERRPDEQYRAAPAYYGDGRCNGGESSASCAWDCGTGGGGGGGGGCLIAPSCDLPQ